MDFADISLWVITTLAHGVTWIAIVNVMHATAMDHHFVHALSRPLAVLVAAAPLALAWHEWTLGAGPGQMTVADRLTGLSHWTLVYFIVCWGMLVRTLAIWTVMRVAPSGRRVLRQASARVDNWQRDPELLAQCRGLGRLLGPAPGSQSLVLETNDKTLSIARLPKALEGFSIAHLSDLHMSGRVGRLFFERAIDAALTMNPDLIAVTGDIIERLECCDWIPETLGRLRAPHGVYFILGNHDTRTDVARIRQSLETAGLMDLGGRTRRLKIRGCEILLAGNELPWIAPAADIEPALIDDPAAPLKILLAHTPDQFGWARRRRFDLMLAGHTHGGQIVFPLVGPTVCPSRFGAQYASGVFYEPPTVLHVSRGISSELPLRFNCAPEVTRLALAPLMERVGEPVPATVAAPATA